MLIPRRRTISSAIGPAYAAAARMSLEVLVLEAPVREVRVDLRRRDVGVAEHLLQHAQVAAAGEQVRSERVAQRVRAHPVLQPAFARVALDDLVEPLAAEAAAALVDEEVRLVANADELRAAALQVDPDGGERLAPDRDEPLLRALAASAQHLLASGRGRRREGPSPPRRADRRRTSARAARGRAATAGSVPRGAASRRATSSRLRTCGRRWSLRGARRSAVGSRSMICSRRRWR